MRVSRFAILVFLLAGCGPDTSTQLVVEVGTDLRIPTELDGVRIQLAGEPIGDSPETREAALQSASELPVRLGVMHGAGPLGPVEVLVTGMRDGAPVLERRARLSFVRGQVVVLQLNLLRSCVDVQCPAGETCAEPGCVSIDVDPNDLRPWDADAGAPRDEACDGADDDGDGRVDEDFDLSSDADHCGACGHRCVAFSAATACVGGECVIAECTSGHHDCDGVSANGCESTLSELTSCGACGVTCELTHATPTCGEGTCALQSCAPGWDNCDGRDENGCESSVAADVFHCGGCGRICASDAANAADRCEAGACGISCYPGWADCDGSPGNGCEVDLSRPESCGTCTTVCSGGSYLCSGTAAMGYECIPPPCRNPPTRCGDSCVDADTDARHCGGCDRVCEARDNASPTCEGGTCAIACDPGYGDCDGLIDNGCETPFNLTAHCGGCGVVCAPSHAAAACVGGSCLVGTCDPGFDDCNADRADGCETPLTTLSDCGGCGVSCARAHATAVCDTGACGVQVCDAGWGDCDGNDANGCETPLSGCQTCAGECVLDNASGSCAGSACLLDACDAGFADCDAVVSNGCEVSLSTSTDCGGCGVACDPASGVGSCVTGACEITGCDMGRADCDAAAATGCETTLATDAMHCGACGNACGTGRVCVAGRCASSNAIVDVDAGDDHTCAVRASGDVLCWGHNLGGGLGDGTAFSSTTPVNVVGLTDAVEVACGYHFSCARRATGAVVCWGSNGRGRLGAGAVGAFSLVPVPVMGLTDAVALAAWDEHACALRADASVVCWGDNRSGQLGDGTRADRDRPVSVISLGAATMVAVGKAHSCATRASGGVACWGGNTAGGLGDGTTTASVSPVAVMSLAGRGLVMAANDFSCARTASATVSCWGANGDGQLGDGTTTSRAVPAAVLGEVSIEDVVGGRRFACSRQSSGRVSCWGANDEGQLGDGTLMSRSLSGPVSGLTDSVQLTAGADHACAIRATGEVVCWGKNNRGQLGDGTSMRSTVPVTVSGLP